MIATLHPISTVFYQPCYQVSASNVQTFSRSADGEKNLSANFKVKEFACKDGSDEILIDLDLVTFFSGYAIISVLRSRSILHTVPLRTMLLLMVNRNLIICVEWQLTSQ